MEEGDLIEISGDDKSPLLQRFSSDELSGTKSINTGCFACSPLPIEGVMSGTNAENPSPSFPRDSYNKENNSVNRVEPPKLNVEPQKMKRKKKGAGFNLRKSLAWDRAFLTEEGVLDSVELSIITGSGCQSGGEMLPIIQEESRESLSDMDCSSDSPGLRAIEEKLFEELPVNKKNKEKKVAGGLLPKNGSPAKAPTPLAMRKVFSAQDARTGYKRGGCPRPPASSSSKRSANASTTKAQNKESKVFKNPVPKSDPPKLANAAKKPIPGPSKLKQNQPAQPTGKVQKSLGFPGFSNKIGNAQPGTKSSLASKSSIPKPSFRQARRNVTSKASEVRSKFITQHSLVKKSKEGSTVKSDLSIPVPGLASKGKDAGSSNIAVSASQSASNSIGSLLPATPQTSKPSGLRMPSPSIGFFDKVRVYTDGELKLAKRCSQLELTITNQVTEQAKVKESCIFEVNRAADMEDQFPKPSHDPLSEQRLTSEESDKFSTERSENSYPILEDCSEQVVDLVIKQINKKEIAEHRSPEQNAEFESPDGSCSNEWPKQNSEQENTGLLATKQDFRKEHGGPSLENVLPERFQEGEALLSPSSVSEQNVSLEIVSNSPTISPVIAPATQNEVIDASGAAKDLMENAGSDETETSVEKLECDQVDMTLRHDGEFCRAACPLVDSTTGNLDKVSDNLSNCEAFAPTDKDSGLSSSVHESLKESIQKSNGSLPENTEPSFFESSGMCTSEDKDATTFLEVERDKKPEALVVKPPVNAVPFSDEWLAAIEAAGEEILTLKTGPVQHSPPEKTLLEPSPWSPVKRKKNQGIGPFDCTKHTTNILPPNRD